MSAQPAELPVSSAVARTVIQGRIIGVRKVGTVFLHLVAMPAPDPYSHPTTVEISSDHRLGQKDEDVKVVCRVTGFLRSYKATDKDTGEVSTVRTADVRLQAVA